MPPDVGKYTMVCQNIGPAVAGSAGPVPPPLKSMLSYAQLKELKTDMPPISEY